jgi:hypothetical protein
MGRARVLFEAGKYESELIDEPLYSPGSADNVHAYSRKYNSTQYHCLISHGELEIARISLSGEAAWSFGGAEIFSEGFKLHSDHVVAVDFKRMVYRLEIETGASMT